MQFDESKDEKNQRQEKRKIYVKRLISVQKEINYAEEKRMRLNSEIEYLVNQREYLKDEILEDRSMELLLGHHFRLYCYDREELIKILDDFIQYKDYFENPPEEAFLVDDYDYSECHEARQIEQLLYKYKIYDTDYSSKLDDMEIVYDKKRDPAELSRENLNLEGIFAILTWLHRAERWCGGAFIRAIKEGTFYNLLKRMEEIRNELYYMI